MINIKNANFLKGANLYLLSGILTIGIIGLLIFYGNSPKLERQEAYIDLQDSLNKGLSLNKILFVALQEKKINTYLPDNKSGDIFGKVKVQPFVLENENSSVVSVADTEIVTKLAVYYAAEPSDTGIHIIPKWIRPFYVLDNKKIYVGSFRYEEVEKILQQQHSLDLLSRIQNRMFKCYEYEVILEKPQ
jgi:hypothetical protein